MNFIMIFLFSIFSSNPKKVILGKWKGDGLNLTINKIVGDKIFGVYHTKKGDVIMSGSFKESIWDQPCSKAYDCDIIVNKKNIKITFVGYEKQSEINDCIVCEGDLDGVEAMLSSSKGYKILYKIK